MREDLRLPSVTDYAFATAGHLLTQGGGKESRFVGAPTDTQRLCGPLLLMQGLTREEIYRYLAAHSGQTTKEVKRDVARATHRTRNNFEGSPFEIEENRFALNLERTPSLSPEEVQKIVSQAVHWRVLRDFEEPIQAFVSDLKTRLGLNALEVEMLDALIRRRGERLFINTTLELKQSRREALRKLAEKMKGHFSKEMMMAAPQDLFFANPVLLETMEMPSTNDLLLEHSARFGTNLPLPTLLMAHKLPKPFDKEARANGLEAGHGHLLEMTKMGIAVPQQQLRAMEEELAQLQRPSREDKMGFAS